MKKPRRKIDALLMAWPFLGSRRMRIAALGPRPKTTKPAPGHKIFPYLLRDVVIDRPNQVWAADITSLPLGRGFLDLVTIIDWASRARAGIAGAWARTPWT